MTDDQATLIWIAALAAAAVGVLICTAIAQRRRTVGIALGAVVIAAALGAGFLLTYLSPAEKFRRAMALCALDQDAVEEANEIHGAGSDAALHAAELQTKARMATNAVLLTSREQAADSARRLRDELACERAVRARFAEGARR